VVEWAILDSNRSDSKPCGNGSYAESPGGVGAPDGAPNDRNDPKPIPIDPDLRAIVEAWPTMPVAVKAGIVAMLKAVSV
jgi:hypothetical protein